MKKPTFLDCPPRYTRTPRTGQSDADRGCALEGPRPTSGGHRAVNVALAIGIVAIILVISFGA
jgi:hypothetical protein